MTKPTFIVAGVQKCATTWLYGVLKEHSDIFLTDYKEMHFFLDKPYRERGLAWYESQFKDGAAQAVRGEFSPSYLVHGPEIAKRIAKDIPDVKIVVMLRDPARRAQSHQNMRLRSRQDDPTIEELLAAPERATPRERQLLDHGMYAQNLAPYLDLFGPDQVRVFIMDDPAMEKPAFYRELCDFIGVVPLDPPPDSLFTPSPPGHNMRSQRFLRLHIGFASFLERQNLGWVRRGLKRMGVAKLARVINRGDQPDYRAVVPSQEQRERLIRYYEDDVAELERLLDRDLSFWKSSAAVATGSLRR